MAIAEIKERSPFTPGQPVPAELFVGRSEQVLRIRQRGIQQVAHGKPMAMFVEGEYGIGKSSIAQYVLKLAEREHHLLGIYASLGRVRSVDDIGNAVVQGTLSSSESDPRIADRFRNWLSKYIKDISFFGVSIDVDALRRDAPQVTWNLLAYLGQTLERAQGAGYRGVFLVLDEINGITTKPEFARYLKSLIDSNAMAKHPLPLLLMLCGVPERFHEMIRVHQPVERIFDLITIEALSERETEEFFTRALHAGSLSVEPKALSVLSYWSAGLPRIMHLLGDAAYWLDKDGVISEKDVNEAVLVAAEEIGKKFVDQQVYKALRSSDYLSILAKIGQHGPKLSFQKKTIQTRLTAAEQKKFDHFLQRMKKLGVLRAGDERGEYVFNVRKIGRAHV